MSLTNTQLWLSSLPRVQLDAIARQIVRETYPGRRSVAMVGALVALTVAVLAEPHGVHVGHAELAQRHGAGRRTVVRRLKEWRNVHRLLDRRQRGTKDAGVTWWAASNELIERAGVIARMRRERNRKRRGMSRRDVTQGANCAHVAVSLPRGTRGDKQTGRRRGPAALVDSLARALGTVGDECEHGSAPNRCAVCRHRKE